MKLLSIVILCLTLFANMANAEMLCCSDHADEHHAISSLDDNDNNSDTASSCDCCACASHHNNFSVSNGLCLSHNISLEHNRISLQSSNLYSDDNYSSLYRPPIA